MYRDIIGPAVENHRAAIYKAPDGSYWDDAGTLRRYHSNNMRLSHGTNVISKSASIRDGANIRRSVVLGSPAITTEDVFDNVIISGKNHSIVVTKNIYE